MCQFARNWLELVSWFAGCAKANTVSPWFPHFDSDPFLQMCNRSGPHTLGCTVVWPRHHWVSPWRHDTSFSPPTFPWSSPVNYPDITCWIINLLHLGNGLRLFCSHRSRSIQSTSTSVAAPVRLTLALILVDRTLGQTMAPNLSWCIHWRWSETFLDELVGLFGLYHFTLLWPVGTGTRHGILRCQEILSYPGPWCSFGAYITDRQVGGVIGRFWTFAWAIGMGQDFPDAWLCRGLGASLLYQDKFRPSYLTLGPLALPSAWCFCFSRCPE